MLMLFTAQRSAARNYPDVTSPRPSPRADGWSENMVERERCGGEEMVIDDVINRQAPTWWKRRWKEERLNP